MATTTLDRPSSLSTSAPVRLFRLARDFDRSLSELRSLDERTDDTRRYLECSPAGSPLARAYLERLEARRARLQSRMRGTREAAWRLLEPIS